MLEEPTGWLSPPKRRAELERGITDLKRQLATGVSDVAAVKDERDRVIEALRRCMKVLAGISTNATCYPSIYKDAAQANKAAIEVLSSLKGSLK